MGRRGRGDAERPERREGGRRRERPEGGGADRPAGRDRQDTGYKDRVHERLDRMDHRLERHLEGGGA